MRGACDAHAGRAHAPARPVAALGQRAGQRRPGAARPWRQRGAGARRQAAPWFERVGLSGFEHARPSELSGGMRQRVSFLRSLLAGKPVLALDEPFASLDALTRQEMQSWLEHVLASQSRARSCWSPTTSRRPSCSAIGSSSCPPARGARWPTSRWAWRGPGGAPIPKWWRSASACSPPWGRRT